jgi:hypothetical protein
VTQTCLQSLVTLIVRPSCMAQTSSCDLVPALTRRCAVLVQRFRARRGYALPLLLQFKFETAQARGYILSTTVN